jgi:5,10-methylenetetrahydromethanopterin reductase
VCVVDEDGEAARARAREAVGMYLDVVGDLDPTLGTGEPPLEKFVFAGTPEEVAAQARELFAAGVKRIELGAPQTSVEGIEVLAERVLPLLRG